MPRHITYDEWIALYATALIEQADWGSMTPETRSMMEKIRDREIIVDLAQESAPVEGLRDT